MAGQGKEGVGIIGTLKDIVKDEGWGRLYRGEFLSRSWPVN